MNRHGFIITSLMLSTILLLAPLDSQSLLSARILDSGMKGFEDFVVVYGEVFNDGTKPLQRITLQALFFDSRGTIIALEEEFVEIGTLMSGMRAPFAIASAVDMQRVHDYSILVVYLELAQAKDVRLSITSHNMNLQDNIVITGKVRNDSSLTSTDTRVFATFYDSNGRIVGTVNDFSTPVNITPGTEATFELIPDFDVSNATGYYLIAESKEYLSAAVETKEREIPSGPTVKEPDRPVGIGAVVLSDTKFVNILGTEVRSLGAGEQVIISNQVTNNQEHDQGFAYIVQVKDADGFSVMVSWVSGSIPPERTLDLGLSWVPESEGQYSVEVFVWESVATPAPLTGIKSMSAIVS